MLPVPLEAQEGRTLEIRQVARVQRVHLAERERAGSHPPLEEMQADMEAVAVAVAEL